MIPRSLVAGLAAMVLASGASAAPRPWKADDPPPSVNGITLGDPEQKALDKLGAPEEVNSTQEGEVLEYGTRGLEVTAADNKVIAIRLRAPEAGSLDGIKVGDIARAVVLKWGMPQGGEGVVARFGTPKWTIAVKLADKEPTIVDLTLASSRARPVPDSSKLNIFQTH
jgi:hypothetical protein